MLTSRTVFNMPVWPFFCPAEAGERSDAERRIHTPKGGALPARMNSHASAHVAQKKAEADYASLTTTATRGPRAPNPGHGRRHLPHLAAGLRRGSYTTPPEDFSSCTPCRLLSRGPLRVTPCGDPQGRVPQASTHPWVANPWVVHAPDQALSVQGSPCFAHGGGNPKK